MITTKKIIVKLPRVGSMTLVGFLAKSFPMRQGNCFSMMDSSIDYPPKTIPPMLGRVVNIRAEDFQYLIKNCPDLVENLEVEVLTIIMDQAECFWILITDERLREWLVDDICSVCVPSVIKDYLENREKREDFKSLEKTDHEGN